jgi:triosephosphate isomerase
VGKKLIIANWKMNLSIGEASLFVHKLTDMIEPSRNVEVVLAPTLLALQSISLQAHTHHFKLAAQNFYWRDSGAFTGEVSANQLRGLVQYALVGHSERRHLFAEHDRDLRNKVQAAYRHGITPVLCVGETAIERAMGETNDVLHDQLIGGLSNITSEEAHSLVIAYEPVWAIGTGNHAKPVDVELATKAIRSQIKHLFGPETAKKIRVVYGGSVSADNAGGFLDVPGVDGLLIGSTSLDAHAFTAIVNRASGTLIKGKKK